MIIERLFKFSDFLEKTTFFKENFYKDAATSYDVMIFYKVQEECLFERYQMFIKPI